MNFQAVISISIAAGGLLLSVISALVAYNRGVKSKGEAEGSLHSDIGYIKSGVDDLKNEQRLQNTRHYELANTVARIDESAKSAHHRIDGIEDRVHTLEQQ